MRSDIYIEYDVEQIINEVEEKYGVENICGDYYPEYVRECMNHMRGCTEGEYQYYLDEIKQSLIRSVSV